MSITVPRKVRASEVAVGDHVARLNSLGAIAQHGKVLSVAPGRGDGPSIAIHGFDGDRGVSTPRSYGFDDVFGVVVPFVL